MGHVHRAPRAATACRRQHRPSDRRCAERRSRPAGSRVTVRRARTGAVQPVGEALGEAASVASREAQSAGQRSPYRFGKAGLHTTGGKPQAAASSTALSRLPVRLVVAKRVARWYAWDISACGSQHEADATVKPKAPCALQRIQSRQLSSLAEWTPPEESTLGQHGRAAPGSPAHRAASRSR